MKTEMIVETESSIIGEKIKAVEEKHNIKIIQLENFDDRICPFSWQWPPHNRIIKDGDILTVFGDEQRVREFRQTATLN